MQIHPYLIFNGSAEEAMRFYQQVLGGTLDVSHFREMPDFEKQCKPEDAERVMHAQLKCDDGVLMASDGCPSEPAAPMDGCFVALMFEDTQRAEQIFNSLSEGGTVTMPWEATFWAAGFGMCKDKYGVHWLINSDLVQ